MQATLCRYTDLLIQETSSNDIITNVLTDLTTKYGPVHPFRTSEGNAVSSIKVDSLETVNQILGIQETVTPATGNYQVYAVSQALASSQLVQSDRKRLEALAVAIENGCLARAFLDFYMKFPHGVRKQTLVCVGRCYEAKPLVAYSVKYA